LAISSKTSFPQMINSIIYMYVLLRDYVDKKATGIRYLNDTINFLEQLQTKGNMSTHNSSEKEINRFFRTFLDSAGFVGVTKGQFTPISIGDIDSIGKKRDVAGILAGEQSSIDDWISSILFQGWIRITANFAISKDLRYEISKYGENCDFEITGNGITTTLVECKRLHPYDESKWEPSEHSINSLTQKILDKCSEARKQFENTEIIRDNLPCNRTLIVDISSYGENSLGDIRDGKKVGLDGEGEIKGILDQLINYQIKGIGELILSWTNTFFFEENPRAIVYYTQSITLDNKYVKEPKLGYSGWSVEFYPKGKESHEYLELRLSPIALSPSWIRASWHSTTDNLITFGSVERISESKS